MSLLALIAALALEQLHPFSSRKYLTGWLFAYANFFEKGLNAGERRHGQIAWLAAVLPPTAGAVAIYLVLHSMHPVLSWVFNVLVLYLTMGFRQFSHYFTSIHAALRNGRLDEARGLLSRWRGVPSHELGAGEVARVAIEQALMASQRNVFGVMMWFLLFNAAGMGGAAGAVLYRMARFLSERWTGGAKDVAANASVAEVLGSSDGESSLPLKCHEMGREQSEMEEFGSFARHVFHLLDWLPIRLTAMTFAIVGNFEDTIYCVRTQARSWPDPEEGIVLASGAGALGMRLGMALPHGGWLEQRPELGVGDDADTDFMQSAIGLVWRSVVFWMILLLLLTLANFPS
jgi:adenosylcobinamide-phosphate synthase